ncbi:MAG: carbohydrate kinase family protein [Balneolaceae bacterium]|nr:carbohydrate kinase family protein [Balneolaceae bacterium]MCH8548432.1 carbohydrate kinase family protein [Balneolaceae bacterium]
MKRFAPKTLVVGELNVDLIMDQLSGMPGFGKELEADVMNLTLGSSSAIFASNLSSLGSHVSFSGMIGDDLFGHFIKSDLKSKGIDTRSVITSQRYNTGITVAFNKGDDRMMVTYPGAMKYFGLDEIDTGLFNDYSHLHSAAIFFQPKLKSRLSELFEMAKNAGLTTSLDTQWDPSEKWDLDIEKLLPHLDYFMPNEQELLNLTGSTTLDEAIDSISELCNCLILKRGRNGASMYCKGKVTHFPAFEVEEFVDAIGAGDSFNAGFIYSILNGSSSEEALKFGTASAAVSTMSSGGTGAIKSAHQVREIAANLKFQTNQVHH